MKIWILLMWLHANTPSPLFIGAYETIQQCEAERPKYDRDYSFGHCTSMTVIKAGSTLQESVK